MRPLSVWLVAGLCQVIFVTACRAPETAQTLFDNYLYRLENSLEVPNEMSEQQVSPRSKLKRLPSARELSHSLVSSNMNLIEFLRLSKCDLQRHIGQRNSSLGRFMKPSQALLYEYEFITLAEQCLAQIDTNKKLYATLSETLALKKQQLPKVQWNALYTSEEFAILFSLGAKPLSLEALKTKPTELYLALETLSLFVSHQVEKMETIESAYGVIASSKRMGELRLSMKLVEGYLNQADTLLNYRIQHKSLCLQQRPGRQFKIVETVFSKFYIGDIQPYIALLHQQAKIMLEKIQGLSDMLPQTSEFSNFWGEVYTGPDSEWNRFERAIKNHTVNWQSLLQQCGRLPR